MDNKNIWPLHDFLIIPQIQIFVKSNQTVLLLVVQIKDLFPARFLFLW